MTARSLIVVAIVVAAPLAHADEPASASIAAAEQLFNEARTLLDKGDAAAACPRFEASYKLDPALGTLLNLATCYEQQGKLASAWGRYREVVAVGGKVGDAERVKIATARADQLEPTLPRLTIRANLAVPGLAVTRDDISVDPAVLGVGIYVDPGEHVVTATATGRITHTAKISVETSKSKVVTIPDLKVDPAYTGPTPVARTTIRFEQDELDPGKPRRIVGLALGGVGIAATVAGVAIGFSARETWDDAFDDGLCDSTTFECNKEGYDRTSSARRQALVSDFVTVGGLAMLAAGVYLYVAAPTPGRFAITPSSDGASVSMGGSW